MRKKLYHGAAFYPELWDEKTIEQDIEEMKKIGINTVRIGEFMWSKLEPEEGKIQMDFLIHRIDQLYQNGIEVVLCTPTVTPPIWLSHEHPERMYVDQNGTRMHHGARQHMCTNNPYFRERAERIVTHMAKAVGSHPGVILWQLDNELKSHAKECMCSTCRDMWHQWLKKRYKSIEVLNEKWGTMIWSQLYQSFEQVPQPLAAPFLHNASLSTMYRLFSHDKIAEFGREQAEVIRRYSKAPITTNGSIGFSTDNETLFESLDIAGYDTYASSQNYGAFVINLDLWRNVKKGKPFWILETSTSHTGALDRYPSAHPKGYLEAEAVLTYGMEAEGFLYWLWRQQKSGCEQIHGAVLSAWGKPTIGYEEVLKVEKIRKQIEPIMIETELVQPEIAITYSDRAKAFLETEPHRKLNYRGLIQQFYENILHTGIPRDLVLENDGLEGYKVLFTPFMHYVSAEYMGRAKAFAENGGIWIVGPLTGGRTEEHTIHIDAALGGLEAVAGVDTVFAYPMDEQETWGEAFGVSARLGMWSYVFRSKGAEIRGTIQQGITPGAGFITEYKLGKGKIVMLGSMPIGDEGKQLLQNMTCHYAEEAGIQVKIDVSPGTIGILRKGRGYKAWVIVNMDGKGGSARIPDQGVDIISHKVIMPGKVEIEPYGYKVIKMVDREGLE